MKIQIKKGLVGLLYKDDDYHKVLKPGQYSYSKMLGYRVDIYRLDNQFTPNKNLNLFLEDSELTEMLELIDVKDDEIVLHLEEGHFIEVLTSGLQAFWKGLVKHEFITVTLQSPFIEDSFDRKFLKNRNLLPYLEIIDVQQHELGLLYLENKFQKELEPGRYYFWKTEKKIEVLKADKRQLQLDMTGQEIMTADKVTLRLNFICQYKIIDAIKVLTEIKSYEEQLYILMQLILREYIGTLRLDELLAQKEDIDNYILNKLSEKANEWGLQILYVGVKDIILPGDIKEILNQVIEAEKKSQANIIMRREETASTRSLLNTAKLMESNPILLKLKELEYVEKISEKISTLSVIGGGDLLAQLTQIFSPSEKKD